MSFDISGRIDTACREGGHVERCVLKGRKTAVLMAVHNGEKYLKEQIDSILNQTYSDFELVIRDDGSTDNSVKIIKEYLKDKRVIFIEKNTVSSSALKNFSELFKYAKEKYDYLFFSDQDDIWCRDKLEKSLRIMKRHKKNMPVLVYTNFYYWADGTNNLKKAYKKQPLLSFERTFIQNSVYGCTILMNRPLINLVSDIPDCGRNHDYWIALVSQLFEQRVEIEYLDKCTLKHRIHENNATVSIGSRKFTNQVMYVLRGVFAKERKLEIYKSWMNVYRELTCRYGSNKHLDNLELLVNACGIMDACKLYGRGFKGNNIRITMYFILLVIFRKNNED